jgi:hypothetical protein
MSKSPRQKKAPTTAPPRSQETPAPIRLGRTLLLFPILLVAFLALWRLVLLTPLLEASRSIIQGCFRVLPFPGSSTGELVTVDPRNGDWIVHASLLLLPEREITKQIAAGHEAGVRTPPVMLQCFTLSLPIFWALSLTVWPGKRLWRILGIGTAVLAAVSLVTLVIFLAYWTDRYFVVASALWGEFLVQLGGYLTLNVVPYITPLIVVIWLHRRLRSWVFGVFQSQIRPTPAS